MPSPVHRRLRITLAFAGPRRPRGDPAASLVPVGLLSLAAVLERAGHRVRVLHLGGLSFRDAVAKLQWGSPSLVGLSCFTYQRHLTLRLARALKGRTRGRPPVVLLGGPHATPLAHPILERCSWIDGVVVGEGEGTLRAVATRLARGQELAGTPGLASRRGDEVLAAPVRRRIGNLDALPAIAGARFPILGVDPVFQLRHLITARGCSGRCLFCEAPRIWGGRVRSRSVGNVLAEIRALRTRYGLCFLSFRDDTFTEDPGWTVRFCRALIDSRADLLWDCQSRANRLDPAIVAWMRKAGCVQIQLGVESGSEEMLRVLRKPFDLPRVSAAAQACREAGVLLSLYLITGVPGETLRDIRATEQLVAALRPASLVVSRLSIYPGTPLAEGIPDIAWFEDRSPALFVRRDRRALGHFRRLTRLARRVARGAPFTLEELAAAANRLDRAPPALLGLAQAQEALGLVQEAEATYQEVLSRAPGHPWGLLGLGDLLLDNGRDREAIPFLRAVAQALPGWSYPRERLYLARRQKRGRLTS
jgi:radical SAM superfamily enzyme YgiQ (UPF0313 family)